jgi:hypothetical protein
MRPGLYIWVWASVFKGESKMRLLTKFSFIFLCLLALGTAQRADRADADFSKPTLPGDISDRSYNIIDRNKLGQYVSNIGQFYSSWNEPGPTCEWPLGSNHEVMYRMNLLVGVPGNVVQTRTYGTKEWDPVGGFLNPEKGLLAISTDQETWPLDQNNQPYWPVRDSQGNQKILSSQDTYGVYTDLTNYLGASNPDNILYIKVHQSSYVWASEQDNDYIIFRFDLVNENTITHDSVYFGMYCDFDAGGFESDNEFGDDRLGLELDRQFFYFYDADNYSDQWDAIPFHVGIVYLSTPAVNGDTLGLTDWHYTDNWNEPRDITNDVEQYRYMSSDPRLRADSLLWPDLFHGDDLNYDDPSLIRETGDTLIVYSASGPYTMQPNDTLTFILAMVCGQDYEEISTNVDRVWEVFYKGFEIKEVPKPIVRAGEGDKKIRLNWDNSIDREYLDLVAGSNTLHQYNIYKTEDPQRLTWTLYDTIQRQFDENNDYIENAYTWVDSALTNGFYYSYAVTAFDSLGDESPIAVLSANENTVELRPRKDAQATTDRIRVVPNPFVISARWERNRIGDVQDGEPIRELSFINLPGECTIRIFTVDGDLIRTINHSDGTGTAYWDIRSDFNQLVATGIYFYHVSSGSGEFADKFAIIR